MDIKQLFDDDRAVSPVIGVILMVAITVILAAVIGTFVLGLGDQIQSTTPQASFGFDTENSQQNVIVTHETGDTIDANDVQISSTVDFDEGASGDTWNSISSDDPEEVSAGSTLNLTATSDDFAGATIRVIYDNPDSDSSSTLGKFEVPSN